MQSADYRSRVDEPASLILDARSALGTVEEKLGQHAPAAKDFREVVQKDPLNTLSHYDLAVAEFHLHRYDEASRELAAVVAIAAAQGESARPIAIPAEELLATIWLEEKDYDRAGAQFRDLLAIAPRNYSAHYNLGLQDVREGKLKEAEPHLLAALQVQPTSAEAHNALGILYLQRGDLDRAGDQFKEAARLDPKLTAARYNLALLLEQKKGATESGNAAMPHPPRFADENSPTCRQCHQDSQRNFR